MPGGSFVLSNHKKMATSTTIAIIGATGKTGSAIARLLARGNYRLLLKGSSQERLEQLVDSILQSHPAADLEASLCSAEACWEADIIILAIPPAAEKEVAAKIREVANQKVVISLFNTSNGEDLQQLLPHAKVVKLMNAGCVTVFSEADHDGHRLDTFLTGNDIDALETAAALVADAGFNPVLAVDLAQL